MTLSKNALYGVEVWECECGRECADESREDIYRVGLGRLHPVAFLQFEMNILLHVTSEWEAIKLGFGSRGDIEDDDGQYCHRYDGR